MIGEIEFRVIRGGLGEMLVVYVGIELGYVFGKFVVECVLWVVGGRFMRGEEEEVEMLGERLYEGVGFGK